MIVFSIGTPERLNLALVLGSTGQHSEQKFEMEKRFIKQLLSRYDISPQAVLPGVVTYDVRSIFKIGQLTNKNGFLQAIESLRLSSSGSDLSKALKYINEKFFVSISAGRKNVPNHVLVFIDNRNQINREMREYIRSLEGKDITVTVIGVGPDISKEELWQLVLDTKNAIYIETVDHNFDRQIVSVIDTFTPGEN